MIKHTFRYFVICSFVIIGIGLFLQLSNQKIFFYKDPDSLSEYHFIKGWYIILIGGFMLVFGLILKWISKKEDNLYNESEKNSRILKEDDWIVEQGPGS
jgi:hypothetical protein